MGYQNINIDCSKLLGFDMLSSSESGQTTNTRELVLNSGENFNKVSELPPNGYTPGEDLSNAMNKVGELLEPEND